MHRGAGDGGPFAGRTGAISPLVARVNCAKKSRRAGTGESKRQGGKHTQGLSGQQRQRIGNAREREMQRERCPCRGRGLELAEL